MNNEKIEINSLKWTSRKKIHIFKIEMTVNYYLNTQ